ncbi:polysaccharide deacetylase family protein [Roseimaritima ulvae]|uniref:Polysaccharide deacetylase n=1 Tax=Roseimaritima ulvae TaxID=980254 RepID=A0A5B9QM93_9BACT|nr:polysaccharide deacetylase family protein [Roseimaritima ulvae]QEG40237.1 Polysaccharide deacetylase [Roseimaritima ulvae]
MTRLIASLSMDLDNQWAYLRAAGRPQWAQSPCYFSKVIPRIVELLNQVDLPLTVFLVGRDLEAGASVAAIERFVDLKEHEFCNHSYNHDPWLHTLRRDEIEHEIDRTSALIQQRFGQSPLGFRGPGFSCPESVLSILAERSFEYDASLFPTSMAPLARAYYMLKTGLRGEDRQRASQLYGTWRSMRQPNRPFLRELTQGGSDPQHDHPDQRLWEVPVTVMPLTRTPIHFSYLTYLASFSTLAAKTYFRTALHTCQLTGTAPSLLLHPPDFMGREDDTAMDFFPAMQMPVEKKLAIVRWALQQFQFRFEVRTMADQVASLAGTAGPQHAADASAAVQVVGSES